MELAPYKKSNCRMRRRGEEAGGFSGGSNSKERDRDVGGL